MVQSLHRRKETPSQTAGPYIHIGATPNHSGIEIYGNGGDLGRTMPEPGAKGERIVITGRVIDGGGAPLRDALVELWQPDARRRNRTLSLRDDQAGARSLRRRPPDGAARHLLDRRARHQSRPAYAD